AVIAGTNGLLARSVPISLIASDRPAQYYRLLAAVQLQEAATAAIHFGAPFEQKPGGGAKPGPMYAVRLTPDAVTPGWQPEKREFQPLQPPQAMSIGVKEQHAVMIERLPSGWFVSVDDVEIGAVPLHEVEFPQIELSAAG